MHIVHAVPLINFQRYGEFGCNREQIRGKLILIANTQAPHPLTALDDLISKFA